MTTIIINWRQFAVEREKVKLSKKKGKISQNPKNVDEKKKRDGLKEWEKKVYEIIEKYWNKKFNLEGIFDFRTYF